jgi:cation diffusion facilitator CzcD-associated flavoprotein CzcO
MTQNAPAPDSESETTQHFDVAIVGAGISGIGAAYHLKAQCPGMSFVILEAQGSFGGTWIIHRYPGFRSDSDLYTFGYRFKPWLGKPIATAAEILAYLGQVIDDNGIEAHIRYRHRIGRARWSSADNLWTLEGRHESDGATVRFSANFLWMCQGYYRHEKGYTPEWEGMETFAGRIVHPQSWPEDLDCTAKKVVVIGSGATAATLIPAIAGRCSHVTMLQRSPTFYITGRNANALADTLRELDINAEWIHEIIRRKVLFDQAAFTRRCFSEPEAVKNELLSAVRASLGEDHFSPSYRPWRQRIAFIPDGDLFQEIRSERASVVTDEIERFTSSGILTKSRKLIEADIVVTATGFDHLPRNDVRRGAEHGLGVRLFSLELDVARRPGRRFRLPASQPHEGQRVKQRGPEPPPRRHRDAFVSVDRSGELQSRLCHARRPFAAETGKQAGMATLARL